jgi:DNA-binding MurR/RpiR family transcriptional regulator
MQVSVSEALVEFPRASVTALAERLGVDRSTVHRTMATTEFQRLHAAYLLERKDLCREDFRRAMANATERIANSSAVRALESDEIQLLKLAGQYTGELSADAAVQVQVNQGTVVVADKVAAALAEMGLEPAVTTGAGDNPAQPVAAQQSPPE